MGVSPDLWSCRSARSAPAGPARSGCRSPASRAGATARAGAASRSATCWRRPAPTGGPPWWSAPSRPAGPIPGHGSTAPMPGTPTRWRRWFLGGLLVHDLLLVPAVLAVGLAVRRLPPALQPPVRAALIVSGTLALMSLPLLLGYGRATQPGNASLLPGDYPRSLAITVGTVWAAAAAWALLCLLGRRGR